MYALGQPEPLHSTKIDNYVNQATLALDPFGDLIEGNGNPSYSQILVYDARTLNLVRALDGFGWFDGLAVNGAGYIYAGSGGPIGVFSPGATKLLGLIKRGAYSVGPLLFDRAGNLYAGNLEGHSVSIYAPISGTWRMKFARVVAEGVDLPEALAIGPSGDLFVANWPNHGNGWVSVYAPGGTKLLRKITSGIDGPLALAVDSKRHLYVGNAGSALFFNNARLLDGQFLSHAHDLISQLHARPDLLLSASLFGLSLALIIGCVILAQPLSLETPVSLALLRLIGWGVCWWLSFICLHGALAIIHPR